jgi:hypothetical protein
MKKLTKAVLAILVVASSITACKKGEDDPGLSLKSRKGRLSQEWSVTEYVSEATSVSTSNGASISTTTTVTKDTYTGTSASREETQTTTGGGISSTSTDKYSGSVTSFTYTIDKEGTWTATRTVKWTSVTSTSAGSTTTDAIDVTETLIAEGNWYFLGKNKGTEDKNKENVVFSTTKENVKYDSRSTSGSNVSFSDDDTYTYADKENLEIWNLSRLAKDELVANATMDRSYNGTSSSTFGGSTNTNKYGPNTTKGTIKITFEKK